MSPDPLKKARDILSRHLARTLVVAAGLASIAGCGGSPPDSPRDVSGTSTDGQAVEAAPAVEVPAESIEVEQKPARPRVPRVLAMVRELELRDEQRVAVDRLEQDLVDGMSPVHDSARALGALLADGIERGRVDDAAVAARRATLNADMKAAKAAFVAAANGLHRTLDADQRLELVLTMRARREGEQTPREAREAEAGHVHGERRVVSELGLTEDQVKALRDGARSIFDTAFPDRKARRERFLAERKAAEDAFVSDTFDASTYSFGEEGAAALALATGGASRLSELAAAVLTKNQRAKLAAKVRDGLAVRGRSDGATMEK